MMLALCVAACAPRQYDDPIAVMLDRGEDPGWRLEAAQQAAQQYPDSPERIKALKKMAWSRRHPAKLRIYAIDQLVAHDEEAFVEDLGRRIVLMQDWDVFDHVAKLGIDRNWRNFTSMIVRHYALKAHGIADRERRERQVLETLNRGKSTEEVVFEVFANFDASVSSTHQVAAWNLLYRLYGREKLLEALARAPDRTAMVFDLKAAAREIKVLPVNREGVLWLSHLRDRLNRTQWNKARDIVAALTDEQTQGLSLRHLAVLTHVDGRDLTYTRAQLLKRVQTNINIGKHYTKGPTFDGPMENYPQHFYAAADKLTWADLLVMDVLWRAINEPNVVRALFAQRDADLADTSTEYGGVLKWSDENSRYLVTSYEPMWRRHDLKLIPSDEMIVACYKGLAHYHFHAQHMKNSLYAGPGRGDLKAGERLNFNFLIFTSINQNRLNVDYHQPDGTVVDLGTITR